MFEKIYKNQNWAKITPFLGVIIGAFLFINYDVTDPVFWIMINIPLYLFHQAEENLSSQGKAGFLNYIIGKIKLKNNMITDKQLFLVNAVFIWTSFIIFALLTYVHIGFGLLVIIFSFINSFTHIINWIKSKKWNAGLITSCIQLVVGVYSGAYTTSMSLVNPFLWWISSAIFSVIMHVIVFYAVVADEELE